MASATFGGGFVLTTLLALIATPGHLAVHLRGMSPEATTPHDAEGEPHEITSQADQAYYYASFIEPSAFLEAEQDFYEGERNELGQAHGQGTLWFSRGGSYTGEFKYDKRDGYGVVRYPGGGVYEGQWKNGLQDGRGTYRHGDGDVYEGEFAHGKRNGQGKLKKAGRNVVYEGEFKDDEVNGWGTKTYATGDVYVGEWEGDLRNGCGTLTSSRGTVYKQEWKDDMMVKEVRSIEECQADRATTTTATTATAKSTACPGTCYGCLFGRKCRSVAKFRSTQKKCDRNGGLWCDL